MALLKMRNGQKVKVSGVYVGECSIEGNVRVAFKLASGSSMGVAVAIAHVEFVPLAADQEPVGTIRQGKLETVWLKTAIVNYPWRCIHAVDVSHIGAASTNEGVEEFTTIGAIPATPAWDVYGANND